MRKNIKESSALVYAIGSTFSSFTGRQIARLAKAHDALVIVGGLTALFSQGDHEKYDFIVA
jgi:uncharacterized membrane protein YjjB (DUF3815 family)